MSLDYEPQPCTSALEYFGYELRRLREEAGKTQDELGSIINYSPAHVSAVENAKRSPRKDFALGCDAALGTGDYFVRLWRDVRRSLYRPVVRSYFELEATATRVRTFEPIFIPGLLQTEAYARAVIRGNMVAEVNHSDFRGGPEASIICWQKGESRHDASPEEVPPRTSRARDTDGL